MPLPKGATLDEVIGYVNELTEAYVATLAVVQGLRSDHPIDEGEWLLATDDHVGEEL